MSHLTEDGHKVRKLTKMGRGRSIGITLPIDIVRSLHWRAHQKLVVKRHGKGILIVDWKPKRPRKKK